MDGGNYGCVDRIRMRGGSRDWGYDLLVVMRDGQPSGDEKTKGELPTHFEQNG